MDNTREFYGWVAAILSFFIFLYPIKPFIKLYKGKLNLQNSPALSITVNYINNICWYIYGGMIFSRQIKYCHLFGMIFNFIFIFIYLFFEIKIYTIDAILNGSIILFGTYALYRGFNMILEDEESVGDICMWTHFIALLSPFVLIIKTLRQRNHNLIPIYFVWMSLSSTISWVAYGVHLYNKNIIFPNIGGFVLGVGLVITYLALRGKYQDLNESRPDTIGIESNDNKLNTIDETTIFKIDELRKEEKVEKPVEISNSKEEN